MFRKYAITLCAVVVVSGCASSNAPQVAQSNAAQVLQQGLHGGHAGPQFGENPAPMPSPHLLTSIDTGDIINITPAQAAA